VYLAQFKYALTYLVSCSRTNNLAEYAPMYFQCPNVRHHHNNIDRFAFARHAAPPMFFCYGLGDISCYPVTYTYRNNVYSHLWVFLLARSFGSYSIIRLITEQPLPFGNVNTISNSAGIGLWLRASACVILCPIRYSISNVYS